MPVSAYSGILSVFPYRRQFWPVTWRLKAHLSDVQVEQLHHQAVEASVVDVGETGDDVVLGVTKSVHHKSLPLQSSLVVGAWLVELESYGRPVKDRDTTVDDTTSSLPHLEQGNYFYSAGRERPGRE